VAALVVDEAHRLSPEVLEEIRLLGNFDRDGQKLLQIVLVGQTELDEILRRHDFRQLKQRVAVRLKIGPLKKTEVPDYIERRWTLAGGSKAPFDPPAVERIAEYSNGLPRLVNALCDNSLLLAFGEQSRRVEIRHVDEGAKDLELWRLDAVQGTERPAESHTPAAGSALPAVPANGHQSDTIPGPLRVPAFTSLESERPSMLSRWTGRLKPGTS
jgi:general secretion pathway protein A